MSSDPPAPLPPREPHPVAVHVAVDIAIAFLAICILGLILGISIGIIIVISIVAGIALAPYTRRTEERQLAERAGNAPEPPNRNGGPPP